jgi:hypothetical protein
MKLIDFKNENKLNYNELAKMLGIKGANPAATVRKWCIGERIPRSNNIKNIQNKTKNKVKAQDFYG